MKIKEKFMKQFDVANWRSVRKKGKLKFIIINGFLSWGLISAIIYFVMFWIAEGFTEGLFLYEVIIPLLMLGLMSSLLGYFTWQRNEKRFIKKFPYEKRK